MNPEQEIYLYKYTINYNKYIINLNFILKISH